MSEKTPIIKCLVSLAHKAGKEVMNIYEGEIQTQLKEDRSPLTQADIKADNIILAGLYENYPKIPAISEESYKIGKIPNLEDSFFLIDPIDGTNEFINKNDEFTINIAFIKNKIPKAGVIYAPAKKKMYYSDLENKAYEIECSHDVEEVPFQNKRQISVSPVSKNPLTITISRSHNNEKTDEFLKNYNIKNTIIMGSSIKFCFIASGLAELYPRLGPTREWDVAAGHAILKAAGGNVRMMDKSELQYGKEEEDFLNPDFIATNF